MADSETMLRDLENLGVWHTHHYTQFHYEAAETIHNALMLLHEQKPVKPIEKNGFYYCGACRYALMSNNQKYCSDCGKKVKWDG